MAARITPSWSAAAAGVTAGSTFVCATGDRWTVHAVQPFLVVDGRRICVLPEVLVSAGDTEAKWLPVAWWLAFAREAYA